MTDQQNADAHNPSLNPAQVRVWATEAGFAEAGVVALPYFDEARNAERYEQWIAAGNAGAMRYLERRGEQGELLRARVAAPFPWARSVVVCYANYHSALPRSIDPAAPSTGWIARYAWSGRTDSAGRIVPSDYHKVLKKRLAGLEARMHGELGAFEARSFVDTGPLAERSLAVAAGLGWTGKNTCLIHPKLGSYGFLACLLTALPVEEVAAPAPLPDRCGSCRRCIEACPTAALTPYQMDATRCIAYLTIEHKGAIAEELMPLMGRQVFGCDICQDVCPWNRKAPFAADAELAPREELVNPALDWLAALDEAEFERQFNGSPVRRTGFMGLRRNITIAIGNSRRRGFAPVLAAWATAADEGLRAAAQWAMARLGGAASNNASDEPKER
jgi:epoxyqueuosine reductase